MSSADVAHLLLHELFAGVGFDHTDAFQQLVHGLDLGFGRIVASEIEAPNM